MKPPTDHAMLYTQTRGADPSIRTENYDPYLSPGHKLPIEVALEEEELRAKLKALEKKYAKVRCVFISGSVSPKLYCTLDSRTS